MEPILEEGLYLSSSDFWTEFQKRDEASEKDREKMDLSFAKYWIRSCTRSTPYGTFAGSALVDLTEGETNITVNESHKHIRRLRLDMNYITEIIHALIRLPHIQQQIEFFVNNSLYELPDSFRYVEYFIKDNTRYYELTSIKKTDYLKAVLERAKEGATIEALTGILTMPGSEDREEAKKFILDVCESQLLSSGLEPCVTGEEPLDKLIRQLEGLKGVDGLLIQLHKVNDLLKCPQEGVGHYQKIESGLRAMGAPIQVSGNTIQTDLFLSLRNNVISKELIEAIVSEVADLFPLSRLIKNNDLDQFKDKFYAKYEEMEVPLAVALDSELGIGYAGVTDLSVGEEALIGDLKIGGNSPPERTEFNHINDYTLTKYHDYLKNKRSYIEITPEELGDLKVRVGRHIFPESMYLMGSLMKKDGLLDPRNFVFDLTVISGPSAGNLLGRFTHGDATLLKATKEILQQEETGRPGAIYAEIAHLPQARIGNVLLRPVLREYEIPYVGRSGAIPENQLSVHDLMISIRQGEVVLRSRKFNRRIIPRLTTAHNFGHNSLPVYKFLCDLQTQGLANPVAWDWGQLSGLKHLPRVVYKNLVIKKARWKIDDKDLDDMPDVLSHHPDYFSRFCNKFGIPQKVIYNEGDSKLLIDFGLQKGVGLFLHYLKRYKSVILEEFLFNEDNCIVKDSNGAGFTDEIIIPLYLKAPVITAGPEINAPEPFIKRKFSPYSEWLYFKIYCGPKTAETILTTNILEFIEEGVKQRVFEKFFFIRFRDEASHFRIRFYNSEIGRQSEVQKQFTQLLQPFLANGLIDKIMLDTYSREIERYGEDLIQESESLFFNDSLAILRFNSLLEGGEGEKYRLLFALRGIDMLLDDFKYSLAGKVELLGMLQKTFFAEFGARLALQRQLDERYRIYQKRIFSHMDPENDILNEVGDGVAMFKIRSEMNLPVIETIFSKLPDPGRGQRLTKLLPVYIHMFMNRLFIGNQRKYELVTYHFLKKYYTSQEAIGKIR